MKKNDSKFEKKMKKNDEIEKKWRIMYSILHGFRVSNGTITLILDSKSMFLVEDYFIWTLYLLIFNLFIYFYFFY